MLFLSFWQYYILTCHNPKIHDRSGLEKDANIILHITAISSMLRTLKLDKILEFDKTYNES